MQQRYYDPLAGRFLSVDPVVTDASTGKLFGRYTYVDNNPYAKTDPDGREPESKTWADPAGMTHAEATSGMRMAGEVAVSMLPGVSSAEYASQGKIGMAAAMLVVDLGPGKLLKALDKVADAAKETQAASKVFSKEKQALVEMAKADKKTGMTAADMQAYKDLNKKLPDSFSSNKVRGPEAHTSGAPSSREPHGHVGPVDHIPIRDPLP